MLARFVDPATVACIIEVNSRDDNYRFLQENYERLQSARDQDGSKLNRCLPCPAPVVFDGARLPASYANFYIANEIRPRAGVQRWQRPKSSGLLQECFPQRK
jgi:agmatine deiminase